MNLNAKTAAVVLGVVFLAVGILGFFPNPLVSATGLFAVDTAHNVVHIVSGLFLLAGAYAGLGSALALKILGVVYAIVAILGLVAGGDMLLGIIMINQADNWLHVVLAVVILAAGFLLEDEPAMA
ncbi:MAG: DUF4383 domain-containing protein [Xanthobacteraceae bacterium]